MSHTSLELGANWRHDEWPDSVVMSHLRSASPARRYVPKRTCRNVYGNASDLFGCSECDDCYDQIDVVGGFNYCPACGAEVVGNERTTE